MKIPSWILKFRFAPVAALVLTVVIYVITSFMAEGSLSWVHDWLHCRGPLPYPIVFVSLCVFTMALQTYRRDDYSDALLIGLFGMAFFPVILGLIGTTLGMLMGIATYATDASMPAGEGVSEGAGLSMMMCEFAVALDTLLLGFITAVINVPVVFGLCVKKRNR